MDAAGVPDGDRLGEPVRSRRKIQHGTVARAAERFLNGGRIIRLAIADGSRFEGVFENGLAKAKGSMVKIDGTTRIDAEIVDGAVRLLN